MAAFMGLSSEGKKLGGAKNEKDASHLLVNERPNEAAMPNANRQMTQIHVFPVMGKSLYRNLKPFHEMGLPSSQ